MTSLNNFEKKIAPLGYRGLRSEKINTLQVNLGFRCNQECSHCHLEASPSRSEIMSWWVMERVLEAAADCHCQWVDLTGGAPELHPHFRRLVRAFRQQRQTIQVRTNLTVLLEPGMEDLPEFLREHRVRLVASLPCYLEENVRAQRGKGVYEKSIQALRKLNALGYGSEGTLCLNVVYNPAGPFLPPAQGTLEEDYRRELGNRYGIQFTHLLTITNMALGRFKGQLDQQGQRQGYLQLLRDSFNPRTVDALMCRQQISIGWDGTLYDCDFNLALGLPVDHGAPDHIQSFKASTLRRRRIVTGEHCFACTAGDGSSCGGALV